ncbi:MAG TPA: hypothetical protein VFB79_04675 [Candidatus Angelobacter sp.]|nr:hypothetical protein [Candidatus Angelobacter sp.]
MFKPLRLVFCVYLIVNTFYAFAASSAPPVPNLPLAFEVNRGQTAPQVKYLARSNEGTLFFTENGLTVSVPKIGAFRMLFENASAPQIAAQQKLAATSNYLHFRSGESISGVENYGSLLYTGLYSGINVKFYGQDRHLEHDFLLSPGADVSQIAIQLEGIDNVALNTIGDLELSLGKTRLLETAPIAFQTINGERKPVEAHWQLLGSNKLGIALGQYDHTLPVTIDPVLAYSTHLGGNTSEELETGTTSPAFTSVNHIGTDSAHNLYLGGLTTAIDFPTTAGAFDRTSNAQSVFHEGSFSQSGFVAKFDPSGTILIYSTFLDVSVEGMAVDSAGFVYAAQAQFTDDPGPNFDFDEGLNIYKLSQDGSKLVYTNQFGQTTSSDPSCQAFLSSSIGSLVADNSGHLYIAGTTGNPCQFATPGAFQSTLPNAEGSGFVLKLDSNKTPATSVVYSTYLGSSGGFATAQQIAIDASGNVYVAGIGGDDFPHGAAFGTATGRSVFVSKLNATGSALIFSTLLHGSEISPGVTGLGIDSTHNVYLTGTPAGTGFPITAGAFRSTITSGNCVNGSNQPVMCTDGFVTKVSSDGSSLVFSTFFGGSGNDSMGGLMLNSANMVFVTGSTSSTDFPTTANAFKKTIPAGTTNAFVTAFQPDGKSLYYSTLLGGSNNTTGGPILVDQAWNAWVGGNTSDTDYPVTANAFQPGLKGRIDGFLAKVVIAGDERLLMHDDVSTVAKNGVVTFFAQVTNLGPDGADNIVFTNPIPAGFSYAGVFTQTADSCTTPTAGATTGSVVCKKSHLDNGASFWVNVYLRATAASGSNIVNKASVGAQTQDLNGANNSVSLSVHVQ